MTKNRKKWLTIGNVAAICLGDFVTAGAISMILNMNDTAKGEEPKTTTMDQVIMGKDYVLDGNDIIAKEYSIQ